MKNKIGIKKFGSWKSYVVLLSALVGLLASPIKAAQFTTNFPVAASTTYLCLTNGIYRISQIQVIASTALAQLDFFDNNVTNLGGTNYTNAAYVTTTQYATNITTTNISPLNGYTNFITNIGVYTLTVTNAANTNALPYYSYVSAPNTLATYPVNLIMTKGLTIRANTNCSVIVTYKSSVN